MHTYSVHTYWLLIMMKHVADISTNRWSWYLIGTWLGCMYLTHALLHARTLSGRPTKPVSPSVHLHLGV